MSGIHVLRTELTRGVSTLRDSISTNGLGPTTSKLASIAGGQLAFPLIKARRQDNRLSFRGEQLAYTFNRYNNSYRNERTVEISVTRWFLSQQDNGRMLEVGNVLAHYGKTGHTVLDKYEVIPGVLNDDIVDYRPEQPFDTVVAVSTLEHVGWDESPREPAKVFRAIENVKKCATDDGRVLVTMPIGHNKALDEGLRTGEVKFPEETWLARRNRRNEWVEVGKDEALSRSYGSPFPNANAVYVGMVL